MTRSTRRRSSTQGGRRRPRGGSLAGRAARGLLEFLLILVLLLFSASLLGWLGPRGGDPAGAGSAAGARVLPAFLSEVGLATPPAPLERATAEPVLAEPRPIRTHLANGCGVSRLAARTRELLRGEGFDVCGISNADAADYHETVVIDRCGESWKAEAIVDFLQTRWGVGRLVRQVRDSPETDVLVILGEDLAAGLGASPTRRP